MIFRVSASSREVGGSSVLRRPRQKEDDGDPLPDPLLSVHDILSHPVPGSQPEIFSCWTNKYFQAQQRIDLLREKCQENQGRSHKVGFCVIRDV